MDAPLSGEDALIKVARLQEGDGAWIRRSSGNAIRGNVWTYAVMKERVFNGRDESLIFTVDERGMKKRFPANCWAEFVRMAPE